MSSSPSPAAPSARILAFGGSFETRSAARDWLGEAGHDVYEAADAGEFFDLLSCGGFDVALVEIAPGGPVLEPAVWKELVESERVSVLVLGEPSQRERIYDALRRGAQGWVALPLVRDELEWHFNDLLARRRVERQSRGYAQQLQEEETFHYAELRRREEELALRLVSAAEYRDNETGTHIRRIGQYSAVLARTLGWTTTRVDDIRLAAAMHDIGKIAVPDTILLKPGRLTPEEFAVIKRHTQIGAEILAHSTIPLLQMAREIAFSHHERWDGNGYPQGLAGERIPESARIVAIADVYDALTHRRVYKEAMPEEETLQMMTAERGRHFDPRIFDLFLSVLPEFRRIRQEMPDECESKRHAMHRASQEAQRAGGLSLGSLLAASAELQSAPAAASGPVLSEASLP